MRNWWDWKGAWQSFLAGIWRGVQQLGTPAIVLSPSPSVLYSIARVKRKSLRESPWQGPANGVAMPRGVQYICYIDDTGYYLGDAEHIATFLQSEVADMTPTWVPTQVDGTLSLVRSPSVRDLWRALGVLSEQYRKVNPGYDMDQTVHLFMPCGYMARYIAFDDLPWASEPCPCGDPSHWLISYTKGQA